MRRSEFILILALIALVIIIFAAPAQSYTPRYSPSEIAVDGNGNIYTIMNVDSFTGEGIFAYAPDGTEFLSIRRPGCSDIAVDGNDNVYVLNIREKQVERLEKNGSFSVVWHESDPDHFINYFTIDHDGNILVSDFNYSMAEMSATDGCIMRISPGGAVLGVTEGSPEVSLDKPFRLSVSDNGTIYVTDFGRCFWAIYPDGSGVTIAHTNPDNGTFNQVMTVEAGDDGYVYVGETYNGRVKKLTADGTVVASWDGCGPDRFNMPASIVDIGDGRVYVSDMRNQRIVWFDSDHYQFGENLTENLAGKGILWDNVIAGDNYSTAYQYMEQGIEGNQETTGFNVVMVLIGIGLAGLCLCTDRIRKG